tara:strand:- start:618 stop:1094 length:477 start_codon:yes stop_codon:yes gene_type:complete
MVDNLKQNIPTIQIILGYILYIVILVVSSLTAAILWIIFNIYIWLACSIALKTYNVKSFIYILCYSGISIAISIFFISGVEQLAYPEGALMFNVDNIMKACLLFFVSTIPIIIFAYNSNPISESANKEPAVINNKKNNREDWEEATLEDVRSGDYEAL